MTNPQRSKDLKSKTTAKKKKEKRVKAKKSPSDFEKLEDLISEFEKYDNKISSLRSDLRKLNDLHDSLESKVVDFKEYFEKKIRVVSNSVGDLETKIDEVRVSSNRLVRDFDKF